MKNNSMVRMKYYSENVVMFDEADVMIWHAPLLPL